MCYGLSGLVMNAHLIEMSISIFNEVLIKNEPACMITQLRF
ncbi:hypothetical protein HORM4_650001 [Vibrio harveyi]|nr:hypothetical protein HORM4_650001 [Vibrio harveyi]